MLPIFSLMFTFYSFRIIRHAKTVLPHSLFYIERHISSYIGGHFYASWTPR
ncbi:hypothetical protein [Fictibacillus phosphorivorans]|uniref:hypothetical protein n=1 Tax=Fictibacillus phosphorivorans TaxID=1221500 RepID=UPI0035EDE12B